MEDTNVASDQSLDLPTRWVWARLGDVCLPPQYGWTTSAAAQGRLRLLRTTDITSGKIDWTRVPFCRSEPEDRAKYLLKDGDIVISRAGSVGYGFLVKNPPEVVFASYLIRFKPLINEHYVAYFIQSPAYWRSISERSLGIAIPNVNASKLKEIAVPVPPSPEQQRIVTKLDQLFSDLDAGVAALQKAKAQLKRYRQAVLKAAVAGELTAEWRAANGGRIEPASVLLERIRAERAKSAKGKAKASPPLNAAGLGALPEGWCWANLCELSWDSGYGTSVKCDYKYSGPPVIRIPNIMDGRIEIGDMKYAFNSEGFVNDATLQIGDLLIVRTNGSRDLIGRAAPPCANIG